MQLSNLRTESLIKELFKKSSLDPRNIDILNKRFGLESSKSYTLQSLGEKYGVTRERVRQLELQALENIKQSIAQFEEVIALRDFAEKHIFTTGGLREDNILIDEIYALCKPEESHDLFSNQARFILKVLEYPYFAPENNIFHSFWYVDNSAKDNMQDIHDKIIKDLITVEQFDSIFREIVATRNIKDNIIINFLSISKRLGVGPYGDIGLSDWEEINPKTVRSKAFLLLKKRGEPMHFTEIAKHINSHAPTVHNELIKDDRFMLVTRGTYSLKS